MCGGVDLTVTVLQPALSLLLFWAGMCLFSYLLLPLPRGSPGRDNGWLSVASKDMKALQSPM